MFAFEFEGMRFDAGDKMSYFSNSGIYGQSIYQGYFQYVQCGIMLLVYALNNSRKTEHGCI